MRILAVDPGEKRIGLAISDPSGTIANPMMVLKHESRVKNAARIAALAEKNECGQIIVGTALHWDGSESNASLQAAKLADEIRSHCNIPVELWDEYGSTKKAIESRVAMGVKKKKGKYQHYDEIAATIILQSYLDTINPPPDISEFPDMLP